MITRIQKYISDNNLLNKRSKVIVGLSGGPDSMALIHILIKLGYECIAAHCNFHLRGDASNNDAFFVREWCKERNLPLLMIEFDTNQYATENKISIEMAARDLRYNWFEEIRTNQNANAIAIAHHRDDSVETTLINLIRGTGIKGLTGIPVKNNYIIRPLLAISRSEIMEYLSLNQIPYVTDSTNEEDIYTRNIIRLNVIPLLETINPSVKNSIITTSANLKEVEKIYNQYIQSAIKSVLENDRIDISKLKSTYSQQSVLFEILSPLGFPPSVVEDISNNLDSIPGKVYLSKEYRLLKDREYLVISKINREEAFQTQEFLIYSDSINSDIPFDLKVRKEEYITDFNIKKDNTVMQVDFDKLSFPLTLRKWRKGDWFIPLGMRGKKKLSDFFTDNKFSLFQKEDTWVLLSGEDIVWIVGHRIDNRFKITPTTKAVFTIKWFK